MNSNAITLTDEQLENVQREMMKAAAKSLTIAAAELCKLSDVAPWPARSLTADAIGAVRLALVDLESIEAIGWPENDRGE